MYKIVSNLYWLFLGTHLQLCNMPKGSLESVLESKIDFARIVIDKISNKPITIITILQKDS